VVVVVVSAEGVAVEDVGDVEVVADEDERNFEGMNEESMTRNPRNAHKLSLLNISAHQVSLQGTFKPCPPLSWQP
jgi:hypothetical protein